MSIMAKHNIISSLPVSFAPMPKNKKFIDMTGQRFGRLVIQGYSHQTSAAFWYVLCDCGTLKLLDVRPLRNGSTQSCGCYNRDALSISKRTHGQSVNKTTTKIFESYHHAKSRCNNPNSAQYHNYGKRGIEFRLTSLQQLLDAIGEPPPNHTLDRIDVNAHYEIGNLQWASYQDQARNRRNNHIIKYQNVSQCVSAWAEKIGVRPATLSRRLHLRWCVPCALTTNKCIHRITTTKTGRPKKASIAS